MNDRTVTRPAPARMTVEQRWVLVLAATASFVISLDTQVVATALTTIRQDLTASVEQLQWAVNAYNLSFAVLLLTGAALGDRYGRRAMFVLGLAVFTAASAACALATSVEWLIAARAVQGIGAAFVLPLAFTQLSAAFPPDRRGRALGLFAGVTGLATFSGPFVGGLVAEGWDWHWIFWVNLPIGLVVIALSVARLGETFGPRVPVDLPGLLLAAGGAFGLVWGLVRGNEAGWGSAEVVGALVAGVVLLVAFAVVESRTANAMLPMRLFRNRAFAAANAASFCLFAGLYGTLFFAAQLMQNVLGEGPLGAGLRLMPWTGTLMICAPLAGNLADRFGERRFMAGGLALAAAGLGWLALVSDGGVTYLELLPAFLVNGVGISMAMPAAQKAVVGAVTPPEIGKASAAMNALRMVGGVLGIAALVAVFASTGGYGTPESFAAGYTPAMWTAAAISLTGTAAALTLPSRR